MQGKTERHPDDDWPILPFETPSSGQAEVDAAKADGRWDAS